MAKLTTEINLSEKGFYRLRDAVLQSKDLGTTEARELVKILADYHRLAQATRTEEKKGKESGLAKVGRGFTDAMDDLFGEARK